MSAGIADVAPKAGLAAWLAEPMLRNRQTYIKVALAATLINLFGLITSVFTMTVYDRVLPNNATASLIGLSIGLAIVIIFDFILRTLRSYFVDLAGADIDREVGHSVFDRLLALRLDQNRASTGALTGLLRELETMREFFASATLTAAVDVPFIVLTLVVIAVIGGSVVLVPLLMVPLVILVAWLTHPAMDRLSAKALGEGLLKQSVLVETVGGLETVKAAGAGPMLAQRWLKAIDQHSVSSLRQRLVGAIAINTATSANTIAYAGVVIFGVGLINANQLSMGALIACSILAGRAVAPLGQIAQLMSRITATRAAYRQIDTMMRIAPEGPSAEALLIGSISGRIEFRNVGFRYPGAPERVIDGLSFTIEPGERVALLGRVGSGKSTVARLLLGLYPPEEGLILLDGTDIRQFDPAALRRKIGAALQESVLFSGSIRENILLQRPDFGDDEMLRAAALSGTHSLIGAVANGYDLRLADRGEGLSGGQRQSIALARALVGSPPVMVFDEPSSAMDAQTEATLIDRLKDELNGRTVVMITHRPPLLRLAQRIIMIDNGRIVGDGPRDAILTKLQKVQSA